MWGSQRRRVKKPVNAITMRTSARVTANTITNTKPPETGVGCVFPVTWNVKYPFSVRNRTYTLRSRKNLLSKLYQIIRVKTNLSALATYARAYKYCVPD